MDTIHEYLRKTESASRKLFEAADAYRRILREAPNPVLVAEVSDDDFREQRIVSEWCANNWKSLEKASMAQAAFVAESFALGVVCGSILQVAAMGIQLFSRNKIVHGTFKDVIREGGKAIRFCIGREVRRVPLGLVVYAGRNQYNHLDDDDLREPNVAIFDSLALNWPGSKGEIRDPAFDLNNKQIRNYAANVVSLLRWEHYERFEGELLGMLA